MIITQADGNCFFQGKVSSYFIGKINFAERRRKTKYELYDTRMEERAKREKRESKWKYTSNIEMKI